MSDGYFQKMAEILKDKGKVRTILGDEAILTVSSSTVEELSLCAYDAVRANYISRFGKVYSLSEAREDVLLRFNKILGDAYDLQPGAVVPRGVSNPITKTGTLLDPSVYTHSNIPVMVGPYEGSSTYGSGGLPASIIDKKARGMVSNGATFKALDEFWTTDKIAQLESAACSTGFNDKVSDASCDSFIYGGSILYPVFDRDRPSLFKSDMYKIILRKGCIKRWVSVDRWNVVNVPSYVITAKDYLRPSTIYIPQSGLTINTSRVAMLRPKQEPYWVSLYNLGWAPSDFVGWSRAYFGYEVLCQSIPVMAQQMSLLLYRLPLDGLNAAIGPKAVRELMQVNEEKMREWSALSPKAVNMVGEVEVVNRTYSGFEHFVGIAKSNLAAACEVPEPLLWHTPDKGFSDNTNESLMKQSESMQMTQRFLERAMKPCTDALIAHVFGTDSEEWNHRDTISMSFTKPMVTTETDLAESGARFAASIASLVQSGIGPEVSMTLAQKFFPSIKIEDELIKKAEKEFVPPNSQTGGGEMNTGKLTKPGKARAQKGKPVKKG